MKTNRAGLDIIKKFEGCILKAYRCPAGVLTIGYGHTADVKDGDKITMEQAETLLRIDLASRERFVENLKLNINENQFSALVSLVYNIGQGNFMKSKVYSMAKTDPNNPLIHGAFLNHVYAAGKKLNGLVKRREAEYKLYNS